jgi:flagellar basal body-associated protein FliL
MRSAWQPRKMLQLTLQKHVLFQTMAQIGASGARLEHAAYNKYKKMKKKTIIILVIIVIILVIAAFFLFQKNSSTSGGVGEETGTLPSTSVNATTTATNTTPMTSNIVFPTSSALTLGTAKGNVTMNNFYKSADYIAEDRQTVEIQQQTSTYSIVYNVSDSSFIITILSMPFETTREAAETVFLNSLGISRQDACKLNVSEGVPAFVSDSDQYIGKSFPLSFCASSTFSQ